MNNVMVYSLSLFYFSAIFMLSSFMEGLAYDSTGKNYYDDLFNNYPTDEEIEKIKTWSIST